MFDLAAGEIFLARPDRPQDPQNLLYTLRTGSHSRKQCGALTNHPLLAHRVFMRSTITLPPICVFVTR